jgi:MFS family permease
VGGVLPVIFTHGAELFPSTTRDALLSHISFNWIFGSLYSSVLAWLLFEQYPFHGVWRLYVFLAALPIIAALAASRLLVESPSYYLQQNQVHAAANSLRKLTEAQLSTSALADLHLAAKDSTDMHLGDLLKGHNLVPFLVLSVIWFTQHFASFGMMNWISSLFIDIGIANPYFSSIIFALAIVPGNLFSIQYLDRIGRKRMLLWGMILSAASIFLLAVAPKNAVLVVTAACLYNLFLVVAWNATCCISADGYFDVQIKSSAMGIMSAAGRVGGVAAQVCVLTTVALCVSSH